MALGELIVKLSANTASFQSDMGKAAMLADTRMRSIQSSIRTASRVIGISMTAAATGFAVEMKKIIDDSHELSEMSRKIGMSTEALSALRYAAKLSGLQFEEVTKGLMRLSRNASGAATEPKRVFEELGVSVIYADGSLRNLNDLLPDIADKFSQMADGTKKTALAQELFGKTGANLIPLLNEGSSGLEKFRKEAEKLGIIISSQTAQQAEKFHDNIERLQSSMQGIFIGISNNLIPVLTDFSEQTINNAKNLKGMDSAGTGLAQTLILLIQTGGIISSTFKTIAIQAGDFAAKVAVLTEKLKPKNKMDAFLGTFPIYNIAKLASAADEIQAIEDKSASDISEIWKKQVQDTDELWQKFTDRRQSASEDNIKSFKKDNEELTGNLEALSKAAQRSQDMMRGIGSSFVASTEEAIMSGQNLRSFLTGLGNDIEKILLRMLVLQPIEEALFGTDKSGKGTGLISKFFAKASPGTATASARGNAFSSGRLLAFGNGGIISNPIVFPMANGGIGLAGEAGDEVIMPLKRTGNGDLGVKAEGGRSDIEINVYAPPGSQVTQDRQVSMGKDQINIMIDAATAANMRPGTKTYRAMRDRFGVQQQLTIR